MDDLSKRLSVCLNDGDNASRRRQLPLNSPEGIPFSSEHFRGHVLFLHAAAEDPVATDFPYRDHFASRKRRFEIRLQGSFLVAPAAGEQAYFAAELSSQVVPGVVSSMLVNWVLGFVSAMNRLKDTGFHYNLHHRCMCDGDEERQQLVWPMLSADTVIATPVGTEPPVLTEAFVDTAMDEKKRMTIDTGHVFTFVWHSMYVDFARWMVCNVLGWNGSLSGFVGLQPLNLSYYTLKDGVAHSENNKRLFLRLHVQSLLAEEGERSAAAAAAAAADAPQASGGEAAASTHLPRRGDAESEEDAGWSIWQYLFPGGCCSSRRGRGSPNFGRNDDQRQGAEDLEAAARAWERLAPIPEGNEAE
eukprot:TRINITY_DN4640_c0_g6_i2.p1 TRINITY_DN4640_c0_g6~~TRINITY_DN4640_c0_g6_i2.p1  ORF type:complete len:359 (+),score=93.76 TRINITY_DN4640_c0_g6_i2:48-1124(+)